MDVKDCLKRALDAFNPNHKIVEQAKTRQSDIWQKKKRVDVPPLLLIAQPREEDKKIFVEFPLDEAIYSSEKMLLNQLAIMQRAAIAESDAVPSCRANMGCGIFASILGAKQDYFPDKMPWVAKMPSHQELRKMLPDSLELSGDFKRGLDHMHFMAEKLKHKAAYVYAMDVQGPYDIAHLVLGNDIFLLMYDDPQFVHHVLELSTAATIMGIKACKEVTGEPNNGAYHYNCMYLREGCGGVKTSEDTVTLLPPDQIDEFALPYTQQVLYAFGGGYIHYCGSHEFMLDKYMSLEKATGLNFGNPEMHSMKDVVLKCKRMGKVYIGAWPKSEKQPLREHFHNVLTTAFQEKQNLILVHDCEQGQDPEDVKRLWRDKAQQVRSRET